MSFIELSENVPASKKFVASIWFRVPAESIAAAKAEFASWQSLGGDRPPLTGIVPLAVFGGTRNGKGISAPSRDIEGTIPGTTRYVWNYTTCDGWSETFTLPPVQATAAHYVQDEDAHGIDPSHIGIDCSGDVPKLSINIVMPDDNKSTIKGSWPVNIKFESSVDSVGEYNAALPAGDCVPPYDNHTEDDGSPCWLLGRAAYIMPFNSITFTTTTESAADVVMGGRPEVFRTLPADTLHEVPFGEKMSSESRLGGQDVTADEWHHLLVSIDLTNGCIAKGSTTPSSGTEGSRTTSACRMHIAFDDQNLTGTKLSCYHPPGADDNNAILPVNGFYVAGDADNSSVSTDDDCWGNNITRTVIGALPEYTYTPAPFQFSNLSFPAPESHSSRIKRVEMAEFQLFTDVTVNTALAAERRAFITKTGGPASLKLPRDLLGKKPEILIHKTSNWKIGRNTGSLGEPDFPEGAATGVIEKFKPEPRLGR